MDHHHNEAYDFAMFEPKRVDESKQRNNIIELPKEKLEENRRHKLNPFHVVFTFFFMTILMGIVGTMIYSQVQLTELTDQLNSASKQLEEEQSVYTQLKMKSDAQVSLEMVEDYAKDQLGMKKIDQSQVVCISLSDGDQGQVLQESGENWFTDIWDQIQNLLS